MKIDRPDLTAAQLGDDIWLAVEGVPCLCCEGETHRGPFVPAEVRALLDPCDCWDNEGRHFNPFCDDCINGRRKFDIVVPWGDGYAGMVSRTYTVADDPALMPVQVNQFAERDRDHIAITQDGEAFLYEVNPEHGKGRPTHKGTATTVTLVGYDPERTTHALHLRAATS